MVYMLFYTTQTHTTLEIRVGYETMEYQVHEDDVQLCAVITSHEMELPDPSPSLPLPKMELQVTYYVA